ncbi:hypothetical protein GGI42DRAFT_223531 [Trichoderma sp. SZMC 28013]
MACVIYYCLAWVSRPFSSSVYTCICFEQAVILHHSWLICMRLLLILRVLSLHHVRLFYPARVSFSLGLRSRPTMTTTTTAFHQALEQSRYPHTPRLIQHPVLQRQKPPKRSNS